MSREQGNDGIGGSPSVLQAQESAPNTQGHRAPQSWHSDGTRKKTKIFLITRAATSKCLSQAPEKLTDWDWSGCLTQYSTKNNCSRFWAFSNFPDGQLMIIMAFSRFFPNKENFQYFPFKNKNESF